MKNYIYQAIILIVAVTRFIKLFIGSSPYAIHDVITFIISLALLLIFVFVNIDKYYRIAVIMLILSKVVEYGSILLPNAKVILQGVNILVVLSSICFAITSIIKTRHRLREVKEG